MEFLTFLATILATVALLGGGCALFSMGRTLHEQSELIEDLRVRVRSMEPKVYAPKPNSRWEHML